MHCNFSLKKFLSERYNAQICKWHTPMVELENNALEEHYLLRTVSSCGNIAQILKFYPKCFIQCNLYFFRAGMSSNVSFLQFGDHPLRMLLHWISLLFVISATFCQPICIDLKDTCPSIAHLLFLAILLIKFAIIEPSSCRFADSERSPSTGRLFLFGDHWFEWKTTSYHGSHRVYTLLKCKYKMCSHFVTVARRHKITELNVKSQSIPLRFDMVCFRAPVCVSCSETLSVFPPCSHVSSCSLTAPCKGEKLVVHSWRFMLTGPSESSTGN